MKRKVTINEIDSVNQTLCPVARAEAVVGDRWTVLILRELFSGNHRFEEIQVLAGATPQMAAARLKKLEADGLVERRLYSERPKRYEYCLTEKGRAFFPVMLALRAWGETWLKSPGEGHAVDFNHQLCGGPAGFGPLCETCGKPLVRDEMTAVM